MNIFIALLRRIFKRKLSLKERKAIIEKLKRKKRKAIIEERGL
jgi:hypothetical protein